MKKAILLALIGLATASYGQSVRSGAPTTVFSPTSLAASYVAATATDLQSYDSIVVSAWNTSSSATSLRTPYIKYQWSNDNSVWYDAYVLSAGTATSTTQPYTPLIREITPSLGTTDTTIYSERVQRVMRYFRPAVKADSATSATVLIKIQKMNNQN
jgi:hypothetical protein